MPEKDIENNADRDNYPDYIEKVFEFEIPSGQSPERLDAFLARSILNATRTKVRKAIDSGMVTINDRVVKPSRKVQPGDQVVCKIMKPPPIELVPENIPLDIIYEDEVMLVVNKPPGMVTHPGFGNRYGTLVNAVLYHIGMRDSISLDLDDDEDSIDEGLLYSSDSVRPGVVHRLDKDTSGLLVISKNPVAHAKLADQFAARTVNKEYYALVWGRFKVNHGEITGNIGRSSRDRKLFSVVRKGGKPSLTEFDIVEEFEYMTLVKIKLHTGRTHQIRVHFSHIKHAVLGDKAYGGDKILYGGNNPKWRKTVQECLGIADRQLLHARSLGITHPQTGEELKLSSELPEDMLHIMELLRESTLH